MSKAFITLQGVSKEGYVTIDHSPAHEVADAVALADRLVSRYLAMGWEQVPVPDNKYTHLRQRFWTMQEPDGETLYEHRMFLVIPLPGV